MPYSCFLDLVGISRKKLDSFLALQVGSRALLPQKASTKPHPMKKKSPSQSAFLNLRIVIGLAVFLSGVCLALAGLGTFANASRQSKQTAQRSGGKSATAANSSSHSFSHATGGRNVEYSPADKDGRFRYMIKFTEKGMLQRQTRAAASVFR